ncbi:MAG: hydrogenase maturation protease [Candidatus Obscuribacterales bacterium]
MNSRPAPKLVKSISDKVCNHSAAAHSGGLALVTIGNSLRGDDGIAQRVCDALEPALLARVCRFDLGTFTNLLGDCLAGHHSAVIVDATKSGTAAGNISITDLSVMASGSWAAPLKCPSSHGLSLLDELILTNGRIALPKQIILFGVEVSDVDWAAQLSPTLEKCLPSIANSLSRLVVSTLEVTKDA